MGKLLKYLKGLITAFFSFLNILITGGKYGRRGFKKKKKGVPEYYSTETWRAKRAEAFRIHGYKCAVCGTTKDLQVHHLRYYKDGKSIFGNEDPAKDFRILCKKHHPKGRYSSWQIKRDVKSFKWVRWLMG
jgi:5-methylcytosine-specific restriction endonuclease McrA